MSLPEDVWWNIGYRLNDRDMCSMELASKRVYNALLRPSRDAPCKRWLFLGEKFGRKTPSPEGYRLVTSSCIFCSISEYHRAAI